MLFLGFLILSVALIYFFPSLNQKEVEVNYYLSDHIIPVHYEIKLMLMENDKFYGETNVTVLAIHKITKISFHSLYLNIDYKAIRLFDEHGTIYEPMKSVYNNETQMNSIYFYNLLLPKFYILHIKYTGTITDDTDNKGFFRIPYAGNALKTDPR